MGHGKTTLIGSAVSDDGKGDPRLLPMLLLDFEGGSEAIESKVEEISVSDLGKVPPPDNKIHVVRVKKWDDYEQAYDFLLNNTEVYKTVAVDSLTEVNYLVLDTIVGEELKKNGRRDPDVPQQQDYMRGAVWMRRLVRMFRDLPMNVIMTALPIEIQDPISKEMILTPSLIGKLASELPAQMTIVGYLALVEPPQKPNQMRQEAVRELFVKPVGNFHVKDRSERGKLGESVVNPTLPKIMNLLEV